MMRTKQVDEITVDEPLTIPEVRVHLNKPENMEDSEILFFIQSAKELVEHKLGRKLMAQIWEGYLDYFPTDYVDLPYAPVASITSITYYDTSNVLRTVASTDYTLDTSGELPRIALAYSKSWPTILSSVINPIIVRFVTGYPDADSIPQSIKLYMKMLIAELRENKGTTTEREVFLHPGVERWLDPYRANLGV